ncbi:FmdB family zinc ribbon protein [Ktedonobacter robiniae]|jgi:putative FmdB family regulatory protein|uniref:FmdB family transcriptional regulator n=1 Tax=Ktedonobacter robiniae TaxID=2778365 RepID=A0ABQ3UMH4_9CHLR|nr:FmdB family zinc ribbon protein [Ktedonobacter robiniae]GHO53883.1 FmdB family transcriptional regulator [Ktedonobacter robiniae]
MPTYEYLCRTCNHRFETWQKMTDEPLTVCPECGGAIRRVLYASGVIFKGSGFYSTDHKGGNGTASASTGSESAKNESATSDSKVESKSESPASTPSTESKAATPAAS